MWLVELAPVGDGAALPGAVLAALGLRAQVVGHPRPAAFRQKPPPTRLDRLAGALSTRPTLLVLDNCEHVIHAAAALADRLLGDCPALLLGASAGIRGMPDLSLLDYPRVASAARTALGEEAFTKAVAQGEAVTTDRVLSLAAARSA